MNDTMSQEKKFTVQEVSERIGRSVYTIGRWQKEGHVSPEYRTDKGKIVRYFSEEDIEILEGVKNKKLEIMLSGTGEGGLE
jgi:DNA-binding transcriptional MerR regulator